MTQSGSAGEPDEPRVVVLHPSPEEEPSSPEAPSPNNHDSTRYALLNDLLHGGMRRSLHFPDSLEQEFRRHQALESAAVARTSIFYVAALFLGLGIGLLLILPPEVLGLWPLGYSLLGLVVVAGVILTRMPSLDSSFELYGSILAFLGMAIVAALPVLSEAQLMRQGSMIGTIHAAVVVGGMVGLRCVPVIFAVVGGGLTGLIVLLALTETPDWLLLLQTYAAGMLVAIILGWLAERRNREVFLQKSLLALEKSRSEALAERMKEMSRHDSLTGLANRRHFDEVLVREWQRCQRDGSSLSLMFIDVDFFKPFNDHYGHQAGDEVLARVGKTLSELARRPGDLAARYGGEEFVMLYPQTGPEALSYLAEELRRAVEELDLAHGHSECADHITVSVGTASVIPETSGRPEQLVEAADHAVYLAKRNGRNRVEVSTVPIG